MSIETIPKEAWIKTAHGFLLIEKLHEKISRADIVTFLIHIVMALIMLPAHSNGSNYASCP